MKTTHFSFDGINFVIGSTMYSVEEAKEFAENILGEISKIPEEKYVVVIKEDDNWYKIGDIYKIKMKSKRNGHDELEGYYYPLVSNDYIGINTKHVLFIENPGTIKELDKTDIKNMFA